ncbi:penicillin-binding protein 2 [candidate division WWE3 bacterium]|nr:penicillin-binding protein 2 [candidate division WWE3 bacterium]
MKKPFFDEILKFSQFGKYKRIEKYSPKLHRVGDESSLVSKSTIMVFDSSTRFWNAFVFIFLLFTVFLIVIGRAFTLQIINGYENLLLSDGNRVRLIRSIAERGLIKDRNGSVLVRNKPGFMLELDTTACDRGQVGQIQCAQSIKDLLGSYQIEIDFQKILQDIKKGKQPVLITTGLTKEQVLSIETKLHSQAGLYISIFPQRDYILANSSAHVLGYVGSGDTIYPSIVGKVGIEESYNDHLRGVDGGELIQVDSSGRKVAAISKKTTIAGKDLILNLDASIQEIAYEELKKAVDEKKATAGAIVALDPNTGGVLGLVSYPSFDPNLMSGGLKQSELNVLNNDPDFPFFNRVISAAYPPASTFKMLMASAALMENVVSIDTTIDDKGFIQVGSFIFRNWKLDGHGIVNILRAIQVSNDTFFYTVGGGYGGIKGLGIDKIFFWADKFGFGKLTGIDINGETTGFVPNGKYKDWYLGDTYISSIGQGDMLATPLQVALVTSYFANGGVLYKPMVARELNGIFIEPTVLAKDLITTEVYETVRKGLNLAVKPGGTGYPFFDFPTKYGVEVAGKTGTAEFGFGDKIKTHAWFTVWGPFAVKDPHSIVVTVFLENGGSGADNAAPIARKIFDYWFKDSKPQVLVK